MDTLRPSRNDRYMIQNIAREREFSALSLLRFPFFLAVLLSNFHSNILGIVWLEPPEKREIKPKIRRLNRPYS